jgi:hypothetical protein
VVSMAALTVALPGLLRYDDRTDPLARPTPAT